MSDFAEVQQQISQQTQKVESLPKQLPLKLHNNYHEMESEQSDHHNVVEAHNSFLEPQNEEVIQVIPHYGLFLPSIEEPKPQIQRNSMPKAKRISIEHPNQEEILYSRAGERMKIVNLSDDEVEEQIIETNLKHFPSKTSSEIVAKQQPEQVTKKEENELNNNSFLDVQPQVKIVPENKPNREEQTDLAMNKSYQLFTRSKILINEAQVTKNVFYNSHDEMDEYKFGVKESASKNSLNSMDSGLQVTSLASSRDELSTRNILGLSQRKKTKLPALKPYKDVWQEKAIKISSQNYLNEEKSQVEQKMEQKIITNGQILISASEITHVSEFVKRPVPYGRRLQCFLTRHKEWYKQFFLDYDLCTNDGKFLLSCKKMPFCLGSTYNLSLINGEYNQKSDFFLAQMEGNFIGTCFNLYTFDPNSFQQKEMIATIIYKTNWSFCEEKSREVQIYLKTDDFKYFDLEGTGAEMEKNLQELYEVGSNRTSKKIRKFINKKPRWNPGIGQFSLHFHGKSKQASVKNAIIVEESQPKKQVLLMAKYQNNRFAFDISYPFSPIVALGVMITSFDFKLASQ